jgi:hypothetical protein
MARSSPARQTVPTPKLNGRHSMTALTMRPTGLATASTRTSIVFCGEWQIGRIYQRKGFPDDVRFYWSLHGIVLTRAPGIHTDGAAPTLGAGQGGVRGELEAMAGGGEAGRGAVSATPRLGSRRCSHWT